MHKGNKNAMNYRATISWLLITILLIFNMEINMQSVFALSLKKEKATYGDIHSLMRKINYRTEQLKRVKPGRINLSKTYQYASDSVKATEKIELFYIDNTNYISAQGNLVRLARFWRQIDRIIGDVDQNADEIYITYLMLYPNGRYHFEANNWVNREE